MQGRFRKRIHKLRWDDEDVAKLKRMWSDGLAPIMIARTLSRTQTAVAAKVARLGIHRRD
jgi:hypothetical protein